MTLQDFIRGACGLKRSDDGRNNLKSGDELSNQVWNPIWLNNSAQTNTEDSEDRYKHFTNRLRPSVDFHVFTNPLEAHRFFEQLNEFSRGFHQGPFGNDSVFEGRDPSVESFFGSFGDAFGRSGPFVLPPFGNEEKQSDGRNYRGFFPRPEFEIPTSDPDMFIDSDLDGKIDPKDIGEILSRSPDSFQSNIEARVPSFSQSVISKTIQRGDGTIETQKTVKDSQGNEKTTTVYQRGDQKYIVTISRDPSGAEKRVENFQNIDEDKMPEFRSLLDGNKQALPLPDAPLQDKKGPPSGASSDLSYWFNKFFRS